MLDLNQMLSSILVCDASQKSSVLVDSTDSEENGVVEGQEPLEAGAFMMLLSQMQPIEAEETTATVNVDHAKEVFSPEEFEDAVQDADLKSFQDNIAIAWIDSSYCSSTSEIATHILEQHTKNSVKDFVNVALSEPSSNNAQSTVLEERFTPEDILGVESVVNSMIVQDERIQNFSEEGPMVFSRLPAEINSDREVFLLEKESVLSPKKLSITESSFLRDTEDFSTKIDISDFNLKSEQQNSEVHQLTGAEKAFNAKIADTIEEQLLRPSERSPETISELPTNIMRQKNDTGVNPLATYLKLPLEVEHPQWSTQFSEQVIWLGKQDIQKAVIQVNPEDLGPLEITVQFENEVASVNITSANQNLREVVSNSLPLLEEMMTKQGLNLGEVQVDVGRDLSHSSQQREFFNESILQEEEKVLQVSALKSSKRLQEGRVDYFA